MHEIRDEGLARPPAATATRRAMLRALLGGSALAANGLFLPAWLHNETEAREGALDGKLGGRHGKVRRGRDGSNPTRRRQRRDRGQKPDGNPPKGPFDGEGVLNIEFIFVNNNNTGTEPIDVTCFSYEWGTRALVGEETKNVRAETGVAFSTAVKHASLYIDHQRHVVWAKNPYWGAPTIEINSGQGQGDVGPRGMAEGDVLTMRRGPYTIDVTRLRDSSSHKVFSVSYEK